MQKPTVDELLKGSARGYDASPATVAALHAVVTDARRPAGRVRKPRRALWLIPGAMLAVGALTAGAVFVDDLLRADLPIAVEYTTDTGVAVSCTAQIEGGSLFAPRSAAVVEYYETHNFDDVGQRIYNYAQVLTGEQAAGPDTLPASSEWIPEGEFLADHDAFNFSLVSFLLTDTLVELNISGSGGAELTSDCTGQLR